MSNIVDLFLNAAKRYPDHPAIVYRKEIITYARLDEEVRKTAAFLSEKGIGPGDRVLVFIPMSIDLYRIVLAIFYVGATAVFLDEWVSRKRMELCCNIANCKGFAGIFKARVFALFSRELRKIPVKFGTNLPAISEKKEVFSASPDDTALITFTTGSTGTPKAAKRTHGFLLEQFNALLDEIDPKPGDIDMPVLPIVLLCNLGVGCTSVIADFKASKPDTMDAGRIYRQLRDSGANRITASPFFIRKLAEFMIERDLRLPVLNKLFTGGAPVFPEEAAVYLKAFDQAEIRIVYGSTEAEPISAITAGGLVSNSRKDNKGLLVGIPYEKTKVKIITITDEIVNGVEQLNRLNLNEGKTGEIIVAGPHVLKEYYNNPEAFRRNKIVTENGIWHRTGDAGFMRDGMLYLTGRCRQMIPDGDDYLSPFLYENFLKSIAGISAGTIVKKDKRLFLVVEADEKPSPEQLETLRYDEIRLVTHIPRDPRHNSKIDYDRLIDML